MLILSGKCGQSPRAGIYKARELGIPSAYEYVNARTPCECHYTYTFAPQSETQELLALGIIQKYKIS